MRPIGVVSKKAIVELQDKRSGLRLIQNLGVALNLRMWCSNSLCSLTEALSAPTVTARTATRTESASRKPNTP